MRLSKLIKTTTKTKRRVGRGIGSTKGKTSGRGMKGQKARGRVSMGFVGGALPLYKKIPFRRGLGNPKRSAKAIPIHLEKLNVFKKGDVVDVPSLIAQGIISEKEAKKSGVKIVNGKECTVSLTVKVPTSASAAEMIEKAGGKVIRE